MAFAKELTLSDLSADLAARADRVRALPADAASVVGVYLVADLRGQFYGGHGPNGVPWVPLKHKRPQGGDRPLMNTGVLANSFHAYPDADGVTVATTHPGARLHLYGGVVKPVKAKMLSIPLTVEAARYGSPRRFPRKLFILKRANELDDGRVRRSAVLAESLVRKARGGKRGATKPVGTVVAHYLLVRSVKIPARPFGPSGNVLAKIEKYLVSRIDGVTT